jgi:hypothetical protein
MSEAPTRGEKMTWTHQTVFDELLRRFPRDAKNQGLQEPYAWLYCSPDNAADTQKPNCAILYPPGSKRYSFSPLHLNDRVKSWQPTAFEKIMTAIEYVRDQPGGWRFYRVSDDAWDRFAEALGLGS